MQSKKSSYTGNHLSSFIAATINTTYFPIHTVVSTKNESRLQLTSTKATFINLQNMQTHQQQIEIGTEYLAQHCTKMKKLITICPPCAIQPQNDLFSYLSRSIISQQLSTKAAKTIFERWLTNFNRLPTPLKVLKLSDAQFQNCGVSKQKRAYIRNISTYWKAHKNWLKNIENENNETIIKELTTIKGVGEWTVQMLLMFALFRLNVFPVKDLGIQKGLYKVYGLNVKTSPQKLKKIQVKWGEYSTIACWYLWRSLDT